MLFRTAVSPYAFQGGPLSDYVTGVGPAGTYFTRHIPSRQTVQSTMPGGPSMDPIGIANVVVGALNLGVGVYNAVQINKLHRQTGELRQELAIGFASVELMLGQQARALEILLKENRAIAEALQLLRLEMQTGFRGVNARFDQQEADAFHRLTLELVIIWKRVGEEMLVEAVAGDELPRLIAAADKLDSWALVSASKLPAGHPARQPFLVGRALALRAVADAKLLQNEKLGRAAEDRLREFVGEIETEARHLCSERTTFSLAAEVPEVLSQYAYLRRGLRVAGALDGEAVSLKSRPLPWADYLEHAANVLKGPLDEKEKTVGNREQIPLKTLRDYEWYLELNEYTRDSQFDLHAKDTISLKELFEVVGAPQSTRLGTTSIQSLQALALPGFRRDLSAAIASEFGWEEAPAVMARLPERAPKAAKAVSANVKPVDDSLSCSGCARRYPNWKKYCERCSVAL